MNRRFAPLAVALGAALTLLGCDDETELPEDPPLAVPGQEMPDAPSMPPGMPMGMAAGGAPEEPDPPLAVPGYDELPDPPPPPMPPGMAAMQGGAPGQPIPLQPGFMPDPMVTRGVAGGPVSAQAMNPQCAGFVAQQPNHVLQLAAPFANLRIIVSSQQDTTLVVRDPQGQYRCNDDGEGLNPIVAGPFPPGAYSVWVGSYQQGAQAPYALGFSEIASVGAAQVGQAAQQAAPAQ